MKAQRATELWHVPPTPKVLATPSAKVPVTPVQKRLPLCIVTPSSTLLTKERTLNDPTEFSYNVSCFCWNQYSLGHMCKIVAVFEGFWYASESEGLCSVNYICDV